MRGCLDWAKKQLLRLPFTFLLPKFRCVSVCVCVCACVLWEDKRLSLFSNMCAVCRGRCFHSLFCCKDSGVFICACACVGGCVKRVLFFLCEIVWCGRCSHPPFCRRDSGVFVCVCVRLRVCGGRRGGGLFWCVDLCAVADAPIHLSAAKNSGLFVGAYEHVRVRGGVCVYGWGRGVREFVCCGR